MPSMLCVNFRKSIYIFRRGAPLRRALQGTEDLEAEPLVLAVLDELSQAGGLAPGCAGAGESLANRLDEAPGTSPSIGKWSANALDSGSQPHAQEIRTMRKTARTLLILTFLMAASAAGQQETP